MVVRRSVYQALGGFDDRLNVSGEDWEMWVRIAAYRPVLVRAADTRRVSRASAICCSWRAQTSGADIRDLRRVVAMNADLLPPELAKSVSASASRDLGRAVARRANCRLDHGDLAFPGGALREGLRATRDPRVLAALLRFVMRWIPSACHDGGETSPPARQRGDARVTATISVCIVCRNERDRLEPCLASACWADEIVVLDLDSTDGSPDLAREYGARVLSREPVPIVEMVRNEIAAAASHDWILVLDPDERVTPGLARYLRERAGDPNVDAIVIPRLNMDFGFALERPAAPLRTAAADVSTLESSLAVGADKLPTVPEDRLWRVPPADVLVLLHDRSRNVPEVLERSIRYAPLQAQSMIDRGEIFSARAMTQELAKRLYVQVVIGKAYSDGVPGVIRAGTLLGFHFWVWVCFWQQSAACRTPEDDRYVRRVGSVIERTLRAAEVARRPLRAVMSRRR